MGNEDELIQICNRIEQAIQQAGMSYSDVEKKTGIPRATIHRYATARTVKIPINRVQMIANATNVKAEWIMGWDVTQQKKSPEPIGELSAFEEKIIEIYRSVPDEKKPEFEAVLSSLLKLSAGQATNKIDESSK